MLKMWVWQNGPTWMRNEEREMPLKSLNEITLNGEQKRLAAQGMKSPDLYGVVLYTLSNKVAD